MAKESPKQQRIVGRVMHEFKQWDLSSSGGGKVKSPRQAIAIALSEAGASNRQSPAQNRRRLKRTAAMQGGAVQGEATRAELYRRAADADISGRSRMDKAALQQALSQR